MTVFISTKSQLVKRRLIYTRTDTRIYELMQWMMKLWEETCQAGYSSVNCCSVRSNSARQIQGDFRQHTQKTSERVIEESLKPWGRLDLLINNASEFHPTEVGKITQEEWDELMEANLRAPFFLSQVIFANSLWFFLLKFCFLQVRRIIFQF